LNVLFQQQQKAADERKNAFTRMSLLTARTHAHTEQRKPNKANRAHTHTQRTSTTLTKPHDDAQQRKFGASQSELYGLSAV
jgi:hypothetical protein